MVVGGLESDGSTSRRADWWDPATDTWSALPDLPRDRVAAAVVVAEGRAVGARGRAAQRDHPYDRPVVGSLRVPRHGLAVVALDGALHVIGGGPEPGLTVSDAHEVLRPS